MIITAWGRVEGRKQKVASPPSWVGKIMVHKGKASFFQSLILSLFLAPGNSSDLSEVSVSVRLSRSEMVLADLLSSPSR